MPEPIVFGAAYSVYVRDASLVLEEKGVPYLLVEIDIFARGLPPASYVDRHPFRRTPAFEHDGFQLYETGAITRYVDEAFPGPPLMPNDVGSRARVNQIISIIDNYGYGPFIWQIFKECVRAPAHGRGPDETVIASALQEASTCLTALSDLAYGSGLYLTGGAVSLADLHAAPVFTYLTMAAEGAELLTRYPRLERWWRAMRARSRMTATRSPLE